MFHKLLQNRMNRNISKISHLPYEKIPYNEKVDVFWQISMTVIKYLFHFFNAKNKGREIIFHFKSIHHYCLQ